MGIGRIGVLVLLALAACGKEAEPPPDSVEALVFRFNLAVNGSDGAGFVDCFKPGSDAVVMLAYMRLTRRWLGAVRAGEPTRGADWAVPRIESLLEDYGYPSRPGTSVGSRTPIRPAAFLGDLLALYGQTDAVAFLRRDAERHRDLPVLPHALVVESSEVDEAEGRGVIHFENAPPAEIRRAQGRWYFRLPVSLMRMR